MDLNDCKPGLLVTSLKEHMIFVYDKFDIIGSFTYPQVALVVEISYPGEESAVHSPYERIHNNNVGKWAKLIMADGTIGWSTICNLRPARFRRNG